VFEDANSQMASENLVLHSTAVDVLEVSVGTLAEVSNIFWCIIVNLAYGIK